MAGSSTARDVCEDALFELNVLAAGEVMGADDAVFVLRQLNTLLDELNAERAAVYADVYTPWVLTPGLAPHTIGPTGTFVVAQRPQSIEAANARLGGAGSAAVWTSIVLRDRDWWQALSMPDLAAPPVPTDCYYNPLWPNGELHFWPVGTAATPIELVTREVLKQLLLTDTFSLPPGYRSMLQKTLAERLAAPYEKPVPGQLARDAAGARARVFAANTPMPRIQTRDAGLPGGGGVKGSWRTGYS
jgi:hypothetical protein